MRIYTLPVIIILILGLIIDAYIYFQIKGNKNIITRILRNIHVATSIALGAFAIFLAIAPKSLWVHHVPSLTICIYSYVSIIICKLAFTIISILGLISRKSKVRHAVNYIATALSACALGYMVYASAVTRYDIEVKNIEISHPLVPKSFDGYRIAQFSDFHLGSLDKNSTFVKEVVDAINAQNADMIVFTGDLVNGESIEADPFMQDLSKLHAPDGVISILGNHDYGDYHIWNDPAEKEADIARMCNLQRSAGWRLLLDEALAITRGNDSIMIIGVENIGNKSFHTYGDLRRAYKSLNDDKFKVLLSHCTYPWTDDVVPNTNIALTLSGHTHAMQTILTIFGKKYSPASRIYDQWAGLYSEGNQHIYVNIGLGCVGIPARFGALPEITIITLKHKE